MKPWPAADGAGFPNRKPRTRLQQPCNGPRRSAKFRHRTYHAQCLGTWNNLVRPALTISHLERQTLTPGPWSYQLGNFTRCGFLTAGFLIGFLPLIVPILFTSRWCVEGLTSGAIKV